MAEILPDSRAIADGIGDAGLPPGLWFGQAKRALQDGGARFSGTRSTQVKISREKEKRRDEQGSDITYFLVLAFFRVFPSTFYNILCCSPFVHFFSFLEFFGANKRTSEKETNKRRKERTGWNEERERK